MTFTNYAHSLNTFYERNNDFKMNIIIYPTVGIFKTGSPGLSCGCEVD